LKKKSRPGNQKLLLPGGCDDANTAKEQKSFAELFFRKATDFLLFKAALAMRRR
jgi:hypothetical protein